MPIIVSKQRQEFLTILADNMHFMRAMKSRFLDVTYFTDQMGNDPDRELVIPPGLVVALESSTKKYVPWNTSALYGVGSDTAVGVMDRFEIKPTHDDPVIDPITHGTLIEAHCWVYGSPLGTAIPAGVKTALDDIQWV